MNFCTSCGQPRTPGARFCTSCGAPFAADAGDEQASPPAEPEPAPEQTWQAPQETSALPPEPAAAEPHEPAAPEPQETATPEPQPAEPQQQEASAPAQQEEHWAPPPQEPAALAQDAPTPPQGMRAPQEAAPTQQEPWAPRQGAPTQQEAWAPPPQQEATPPQQDAWATQPAQDTWAAPAAGFAAPPGTPLGADPNAPDDPFGHLFRGGPPTPAGPEGGYAGPEGGYAGPEGGYAGPEGGYAGPEGGYAGPEGGYAGPPGPGYGETMVAQPYYPEGGPPGEPPPGRHRARTITLLAGVVVVLVAGGVGAWAALGGKGHPSAQPTHSAHPTTTAPSTSAQPSTSAPSTSAAPSHKHSGLVAASPSVRGKQDEPAVLAFLNDYFAAINTHNYQRYYGLLDAQQQSQVTQGQFDAGYRKSRDSHATLVALGPAGGGITAASVTFISHQPASVSPTHTSCTVWGTTLYLRHQGGSYVIGAPPASYRASYHAC